MSEFRTGGRTAPSRTKIVDRYRTDDRRHLYRGTCLNPDTGKSCSCHTYKFCRLHSCLCTRSESRNRKLSDLSLPGSCRTPCIFRIQRRYRKTGRTYRRISRRISFSCIDSGFPDVSLSREECRSRNRYDPRNCRMLLLWNRLAGRTDASVLWRCADCRA